MKSTQNYCAPDSEAQESFRTSRTCFTLSSLQKLARAWNERGGATPIPNPTKQSKTALWRALNARMKAQCESYGRIGKEGCWLDQLRIDEHSEPFQDMRQPKPASWYKNPRTWLNNYDIEDVMAQYEAEPAFKYHFLGVFPMDFAEVYRELNDLRWTHLTKNGTASYIGMITNLDDHDEPGSHWTSFFAVLDPRLPSFGAYYYDSVSSPPTKEIKTFMIKLMLRTLGQWLQSRISASDLESILAYPFKDYNGTEVKSFSRFLAPLVRKYTQGNAGEPILPYPFKLEWNTHQHQYKNTECGVFSMVYQIRWLEGLRTNPNVVFGDVVQHRMQDDEIHRFRDVLFRPSAPLKPKPKNPVKDKKKKEDRE
jgi:hypothetical protein